MVDENINLLKSLIGNDAEIVSSLHGGMMNEAYIVKSSNGKYVFYLPTEQANEMVNRKLEKEAQDIAENLGITRKTVYFDLQTGIKLSEFIEGDSLNHIEDIDYKKVAELLCKFHEQKEKSSEDYNPIVRLCLFKKEAETFLKEFDKEFYELFDLIQSKRDFLEGQRKVISHNDAQRSNFIKDENGNYSLIDYEFAMNNDPLYDIATFGNDHVSDGLEVLKEYTKLVKEENAKERYLLWRIDVSLQWYLVAIIKHYRGEGATHNIDFLAVAHHFLNNALEAYKYYVAI